MPEDPAMTRPSQREVDELRRQLDEARETLEAIRRGEVDAIVVNQGEGNQVFTLDSAERPYRLFMEEMQQGAVTLGPEGRILFCNRRFGEMVQAGHGQVLGRSFETFVVAGAREQWRSLLVQARSARAAGELQLERDDGGPLPASVGISTVDTASGMIYCLVVSDLTEHRHHQRLIAAQRELRLSEERFRLTLLSLGYGVVTTDSHGAVTFMNPIAEALTGWTTAKASGSPLHQVFRLVSEKTRKPVPNPLTRGFRDAQSGTLDTSSLLLSRDDVEIPIEYNATPMLDQEGALAGAVLVFHDVTAQRWAENTMRLSEERRRLAAKAAMVGTYSFDFATGEAHLSEEFRTLWGSRSGGRVILDDEWIQGLPPGNRAAFMSAMAAARDAAGDGQIDFEYRLMHQDGSVRWLSIKGNTEFSGTGADRRPLRAFGAVVDVTERKGREQEILALNRTLRAVSDSDKALMRAQSASEGDFLVEVCRIITEDCGHAMVWIGFADLDEARSIRPVASAGVDKVYLEQMRLSWADTERGRGPAGVAIRTGEPALCRDMTTDPAFGPWRDAALERGYRSAVVLPLLEGGRAFGAITIYSREPDAFPEAEVALLRELAADLAYGIQIHRLRAEHAKAGEALAAASRRKDEFLAALAHELRNPLAPIRNAARILTQRASDDPELATLYALVDRQAGQMARLVDDLLDVSRLERGKIRLKRERLDFSSMASHAVEACRTLIDECRHSVEVLLPGEALEVDGDPVRVEQMVCNLVTNACRHTPPGGRIRVAVERDGAHAVLRVRDNGVGMTPEVMAHMFEMFYQAEHGLVHQEEGLGVGLTLVRTLAELHGGSVAAASDGLGKGSEFTLRLPALEPAERPVQAQAPEPSAVPKPGADPKHILVVDDNQGVVTTVKMLLGACGYRVSTAATGAAGVKQATKLRPDLALVDLGLPDMTGLEVAARIRAELGSAIRLIALTGFSRECDIAAALAAGFDQHLVKSADPRELLAAVDARLQP
jgi:PAS domain S-box-containing protein